MPVDFSAISIDSPVKGGEEMALKHRVCIRVRDADGAQEPVVTGGTPTS